MQLSVTSERHTETYSATCQYLVSNLSFNTTEASSLGHITQNVKWLAWYSDKEIEKQSLKTIKIISDRLAKYLTSIERQIRQCKAEDTRPETFVRSNLVVSDLGPT